MSQAKYYIYRNLTRGGFSVKYKGKVISHCSSILAYNTDFRVNELSRQRVIKEKKKYVHAFVACDSWEEITPPLIGRELEWIEVRYNPFKNNSFVILDGVKILKSEYTVLTNNKVYVPNLVED